MIELIASPFVARLVTELEQSPPNDVDNLGLSQSPVPKGVEVELERHLDVSRLC